MKIQIWIHKTEAISGNIAKHYFTRPYHDRHEDWVQVSISVDEFARLEDKKYPNTETPVPPCNDINLTYPEFREKHYTTSKLNSKLESLIKSKEVREHSSAYYDYTRNMSQKQIAEFDKNFSKVYQELVDWYSGLSPIHQTRISNTFGMFFNDFEK